MKFTRPDIRPVLKKWIPLGFSVTAVFLFGYVAIQQNYRMSANDTQAEIISNIDLALGEGTPYKLFNTNHPVELGKSLTPYVLLYDLNGKPLAGSGILNGNYPVPPQGIFDYLIKNKEDRFTWEPEKGVRQAVVAKYHDGPNPAFIIVGRSLSEVENHIDQLSSLTLLLWFLTMAGSLFLTALLA